MATTLEQCSQILAREGVRHHLDAVQGAILAAFVTRRYHNLRREKLAIVRIETPDGGHRCRVGIARAFTAGADPASMCLLLGRLAADTPLVGFEYDADRDDLRMVAEMPVEDGEPTSLQLLSMVDRVVEAAEAWYAALFQANGRRKQGSAVAKGPRPRRRGAA